MHQINDQVAQRAAAWKRSVRPGKRPRQWQPDATGWPCRLNLARRQRQQGQAVIPQDKQHRPGEDPCRQRPEASAKPVENQRQLAIPVWAAAYRHCLLLHAPCGALPLTPRAAHAHRCRLICRQPRSDRAALQAFPRIAGTGRTLIDPTGVELNQESRLDPLPGRAGGECNPAHTPNSGRAGPAWLRSRRSTPGPWPAKGAPLSPSRLPLAQACDPSGSVGRFSRPSLSSWWFTAGITPAKAFLVKAGRRANGVTRRLSGRGDLSPAKRRPAGKPAQPFERRPAQLSAILQFAPGPVCSASSRLINWAVVGQGREHSSEEGESSGTSSREVRLRLAEVFSRHAPAGPLPRRFQS